MNTKQLRKSIVDVAKRILSGETGVIAGSRELISLLYRLEIELDDPDFNILIGIESETDHLPIGEPRKYWSSEALVEKDKEIKEKEGWYRDDAEEACRNFIKKYNNSV